MIAQKLNRTDVECRNRWNQVLKPGYIKGPWSPEEDQVIITCMSEGITRWGDVAKRVPGRIGKQCRERWCNHLDPSLKKTEWTLEEDNLLSDLQLEYGNSWTKIALEIPGRGENEVKNRWNSADRKKRLLENGCITHTQENRPMRQKIGFQNEVTMYLCLSDTYLSCYRTAMSRNDSSPSNTTCTTNDISPLLATNQSDSDISDAQQGMSIDQTLRSFDSLGVFSDLSSTSSLEL